jgi:hypothetical protein
MAWMSWRPEIPDPEKDWEEFDRRIDEQKDEAVLKEHGWHEKPPPPPTLNQMKRTKKGDPHAKLVCQ